MSWRKLRRVKTRESRQRKGGKTASHSEARTRVVRLRLAVHFSLLVLGPVPRRRMSRVMRSKLQPDANTTTKDNVRDFRLTSKIDCLGSRVPTDLPFDVVQMARRHNLLLFPDS